MQYPINRHKYTTSGFTLIEMSMVLVIIGLIVGGILTGQELIKAAAMRAQISQIEKYNVAVRTFQNKYGGIPGDLPVNTAGPFGFQVTGCGPNPSGNRDGNGFINGGAGFDDPQQSGENLMFWQDLSVANLIDQTFPNSGGSTVSPCSSGQVLSLTLGTTYIGDFFPVAKIGQGNFIYVYDGGNVQYNVGGTWYPWPGNGYNWYGVSAMISTVANGGTVTNPGLTVMQAYNMDKKIDDGIPNSGSVQAVYNTNWALYAANPQASDSATSCYNTTTNTYSIGINGGNGLNCALSFKFQ